MLTGATVRTLDTGTSFWMRSTLDSECPKSIQDVPPCLGEPALLTHPLHKLIEVVHAKEDLVQHPPIVVLQVWTFGPIKPERRHHRAFPHQGKNQNTECTGAMFSLPAMDQHILTKHKCQQDYLRSCHHPLAPVEVIEYTPVSNIQPKARTPWVPSIADVRAIDDVCHVLTGPLHSRLAVADVELAPASVAWGLPRQQCGASHGRSVMRSALDTQRWRQHIIHIVPWHRRKITAIVMAAPEEMCHAWVRWTLNKCT